MKHINLVHEKFKDDPIIDQLFGPLDPSDSNDNIIFFDDTLTKEQIFVDVGLFPSLTQARKNKQSGPIPDGWTEIHKKKRRLSIFILNKFDET